MSSNDINIDAEKLDWNKGADGLLPVVIQDANTLEVLMLGYMNKEALLVTLESGFATFFSRSKQRLWKKGETSGNVLAVQSCNIDCDNDTILIKAVPHGPTCHTGTTTCFGDVDDSAEGRLQFLAELGALIKARKVEMPEGSYTTSLFKDGRERISQKVGEEGVEVALAHMSGNKPKILEEAADLIYHTLILLENEDLSLAEVCKVLEGRHKS